MSQDSAPPIDFLIITALMVERDAVLTQLGEYSKIQYEGSPTYYRATVPAYARDGVYHIAVTMLSHMGNVAAVERTTRAINDLNPSYVLMVGIAGGIKGQVRLGDVVVATQVLYYEQVKQTPDGPDSRPQAFPVDPVLLERAQNYNELTWQDHISVPRPPARSQRADGDAPLVHFGPFAVGDKVVTDPALVARFKKLHAKVAAVEMESFGVAFAAATSVDRPRFLAIRGISDYADPKKDDRWQAYAAATAAAFATGFLRAGPVTPRAVRAAQLTEIHQRTLIAIRHQSQEPIPEKAIVPVLPPELERVAITELVIDQTDLCRNDRLRDPLMAAQRQIDIAQRLDALRAAHPGAIVAYYGIAHIPLLFLAGYRLSDQRNLYLFDYNRHIGQWSQLQGGGSFPELRVEGLPTRVRHTGGDVILRISISYPVALAAAREIVVHPLAAVHLMLAEPALNAVTSEYQTRTYGTTFRTVLDTLVRMLPNIRRIHIFYAGPATLAFHLGRQISKSIHPHVTVYNYMAKDCPPYSWGLTITSDLHASDFLIQPTSTKEVP